MNNKFFTIPLMIAFTLVSYSAIASLGFLGDWTLAKDKNEVQVFTRKVDGYSLKEYKGVTTVKASVADILVIMRDVAAYPKWQNVKTVKMLEKKSDDEFIYYTITDAPWPVSDRDNISQTTITKNDKGEVRINIIALPDYQKPVSGMVRIPEFKGFWKLIPQADNITKIVHQGLADPGGNIPDWLANASVVDTPFDSLVELRKMLGN